MAHRRGCHCTLAALSESAVPTGKGDHSRWCVRLELSGAAVAPARPHTALSRDALWRPLLVRDFKGGGV